MPEVVEHDLVETRRLVEAMSNVQPTGRRMRIQLITPGWGSSGYYSPEVLKEAATNKVFAAGTSMYIDHQTLSEANDRVHGERSLKDLAARFATDAHWDGHALVADVEAFGAWRPVIADMAEHVGVSIRSMGRGEPGAAEGRQGLVVSSIDQAKSVDFVAEAGRGGRVLQLLESKDTPLSEADNAGHWLESRLQLTLAEVADAINSDSRITPQERVALTGGIGDSLAAFTSRVEADAPRLFTTPVAETATPPVTTTANATSVTYTTPTTEEAAPAAPITTEESKEDPMPETEGAADTATPPTLPTARRLIEAELAQERRNTAVLRARDEARPLLSEALTDGWVPPATVRRITEALMRDLPLTEANTLDRVELIKRASQDLAQAEHEIAEAMTAAGVGRPRDLGFTEASTSGLGAGELDSRLESAFAGLGLNESTAKLAAKGRD